MLEAILLLLIIGSSALVMIAFRGTNLLSARWRKRNSAVPMRARSKSGLTAARPPTVCWQTANRTVALTAAGKLHGFKVTASSGEERTKVEKIEIHRLRLPRAGAPCPM